MGFSTRLRAGTTSIVSSQPGVERAGPEGWQVAGWSWESEAARLGCVAGEGFSHSSLELGEAGSRQDGVPEGGERHTTASIPLLPARTSDFSQQVGGFLVGISQTPPHTHPPRSSPAASASHATCRKAAGVREGEHPLSLTSGFTSFRAKEVARRLTIAIPPRST